MRLVAKHLSLLACFCAVGLPRLAPSQDPVLRDLPESVKVGGLKDIDGHSVTLPDSEKPVVLIFIGVDCPIARRYAPEINRVIGEFGKSARFYLVFEDQKVSFKEMRQYAKERKMRCPILWDSSHQIAKAVGASVTPEVALVSKSGEVRYRGRIDDRFVDHGKEKLKPSRRDLHLALASFLADTPIAIPQTEAVGCAIPFGG